MRFVRTFASVATRIQPRNISLTAVAVAADIWYQNRIGESRSTPTIRPKARICQATARSRVVTANSTFTTCLQTNKLLPSSFAVKAAKQLPTVRISCVTLGLPYSLDFTFVAWMDIPPDMSTKINILPRTVGHNRASRHISKPYQVDCIWASNTIAVYTPENKPE